MEEEKKRRRHQLEAAASLTPIPTPLGFVPQREESVFLEMKAALAERRRSRGYSLGSGGVRIYERGQDEWTFTDKGKALVTSKRLVFLGEDTAVEWRFDKLMGLGGHPHQSVITPKVSNRQKPYCLQLNDFWLFKTALESALRAHLDESYDPAAEALEVPEAAFAVASPDSATPDRQAVAGASPVGEEGARLPGCGHQVVAIAILGLVLYALLRFVFA